MPHRRHALAPFCHPLEPDLSSAFTRVLTAEDSDEGGLPISPLTPAPHVYEAFASNAPRLSDAGDKGRAQVLPKGGAQLPAPTPGKEVAGVAKIMVSPGPGLEPAGW